MAEGVVTVWPRFFPAVQMVFSGYAGLRYTLYPQGFRGMTIGQMQEIAQAHPDETILIVSHIEREATTT